jgi:hypothetical protein
MQAAIPQATAVTLLQGFSYWGKSKSLTLQRWKQGFILMLIPTTEPH